LRVLDLFCGPGGAAAGYLRAGAEVIGVDLEPQPLNPASFVLADAFAMMRGPISPYDLIHAAPPARFAKMGELREALDLTGVDYIIENVVGWGSLRADLFLCGKMFGLDFTAHRSFEATFPLRAPGPHPDHRFARSHRGRDGYVCGGVWRPPLAEQRRRLEIGALLDQRQLAEATPPAFAVWIADQFRR